jgi:transposase-like protein
MNVLPMEKQVQIVGALVEGNSIRATARMYDVEHKTVMRVLLRAGANCERVLDQRMRGIHSRFVQADEIWTYVGKKEKRIGEGDDPMRVGDQYVYVAMDSETKLVPCYRVGKRNAANTWYFVRDLESRLASRVQLTTDGFRPYLPAVEDAFGANVDYAMLIKTYQEPSAMRSNVSSSKRSPRPSMVAIDDCVQSRIRPQSPSLQPQDHPHQTFAEIASGVQRSLPGSADSRLPFVGGSRGLYLRYCNFSPGQSSQTGSKQQPLNIPS